MTILEKIKASLAITHPSVTAGTKPWPECWLRQKLAPAGGIFQAGLSGRFNLPGPIPDTRQRLLPDNPAFQFVEGGFLFQLQFQSVKPLSWWNAGQIYPCKQ